MLLLIATAGSELICIKETAFEQSAPILICITSTRCGVHVILLAFRPFLVPAAHPSLSAARIFFSFTENEQEH